MLICDTLSGTRSKIVVLRPHFTEIADQLRILALQAPNFMFNLADAVLEIKEISHFTISICSLTGYG